MTLAMKKKIIFVINTFNLLEVLSYQSSFDSINYSIFDANLVCNFTCY